ncbi:hypothetical protein DNK47_02965 [Mycoplasma wenyonii]|uniref:Uncharacterized protein n=1 Tax=Mycoplasma wenyonii TaxID=65123 RepID=A0A328PNY2_9MOLU|nr:hypothetical protein [Mycoplasma wenyonii]RAO94826.1 hypothetical protein DNK47_02965 [Mycoplasma wenyonii]
MLDREGYLFSMSGGWKKILKRGPYKYRISNLAVRVKTEWRDWDPKDLYYRKPEKAWFWQQIDWEETLSPLMRRLRDIRRRFQRIRPAPESFFA